MSSSNLGALKKAKASELLEGDTCSGKPSSSVRTISRDHKLHKPLEQFVDESIAHSAHSLRLERVEVVCANTTLSREFKQILSRSSDYQVHFLFHGTKSKNHSSIFDEGFQTEYLGGSTDAGFIGSGFYFSPHIEYAAAYIREDGGQFNYKEPVKSNETFQVLACVVITGKTRCLEEKAYGDEIPEELDSHNAWVDTSGKPTGVSSKRFAVEYAIRDPKNIYPRFRLTLKRVPKEVVWVDQNITNSENSGHVKQLKEAKDQALYATATPSKALATLKKRKPGTTYRAMTAGRGGEEFVRDLRAAGIQCQVLVFCGSVDYHKTWARKFTDVEVTCTTSKMKDFTTWK